jgi:hypothetical protein
MGMLKFSSPLPVNCSTHLNEPEFGLFVASAVGSQPAVGTGIPPGPPYHTTLPALSKPVDQVALAMQADGSQTAQAITHPKKRACRFR